MFQKITAVIMALCVTSYLVPWRLEEPILYDEFTIVVSVYEDKIIVVDTDGYEWAFFGEGFAVGDAVIVEFDANGSEDPDDDFIVDAWIVENPFRDIPM